MGALLGKYNYVKIRMAGGCYLGPRPIDLHLKSLRKLMGPLMCHIQQFLR